MRAKEARPKRAEEQRNSVGVVFCVRQCAERGDRQALPGEKRKRS